MLPEVDSDREVKLCCSTFYQSDIVRMLLGDVFHPGGLELTGHLGETMGLGAGQRVLDVACGRGVSAVYLAEHFGAHVSGVDYGPENVAAAEAHAAARGVSHLTEFRQADAEDLPFPRDSFDAVISECSFCTFPSQEGAARSMARVLRSGGRLGLTDMTVDGPLPEDIRSLLAWVACLGGAGPAESYVSKLEEAGFTNFVVEDQRNALLDMVVGVRRKLLGAELAVGLGKLDLGKLDLGEFDLGEVKGLARNAGAHIESGLIGYTLIVADNG
ncbi:MAG: methyltransferase domain-containing protein [Dehalococcoidia bacterium]